MTKIRESIDALYAAHKEIGQGTMPKEQMLALVLTLVENLIEVTVEVAHENQQLRSELENYQDAAFHKGRLQ